MMIKLPTGPDDRSGRAPILFFEQSAKSIWLAQIAVSRAVCEKISTLDHWLLKV